MKAELILRFTPEAASEVPSGYQLGNYDTSGAIPAVGDDYAIAGANETIVFRVIRRQFEHRSGIAEVTLVLDNSPETYIRSE